MPDDFTGSLAVTFFAAFLVLFIAWFGRVNPLLDAIPTVGFSNPILSYLSAFRFKFGGGVLMLKEGYKKTKPGLFKVASFQGWIVVLSGSELIEEVTKSPDNTISVREPLEEFLQLKYTLKFLNMEDMYHRNVTRLKLTRNIAATFDPVHDEVVGSLGDCIPTIDHEWVKVSIVPTMQRIVVRITSRAFVGAPLCNDYDYQTLVMSFIENFSQSAFFIGFFPKILKPIVARLISHTPSHVRQTMQYIGPIVEERSAKMEEFGEDWDDAPNDMLMWLMSEAQGVEKSLEGWVRRLLMLYVGAFTISIALTQTLYRLLAHPEYIGPLRQEVDAVVAKEGWTKAGMDKMHKIDSFARESLRIDNRPYLGSYRLALRPFTFSSGVTIPAGTLLAHPTHSIHTDEELYANAQEFDGFRFLKLREKEGEAMAARHQFVTTSPELLGFGLGRHACPGRFLAAIQVKMLIAHILVEYDFKFEDGKGVPPERHAGLFSAPGNTNILFRKRQK